VDTQRRRLVFTALACQRPLFLLSNAGTVAKVPAVSSNPLYSLFATSRSSGPLILRFLLSIVFFVHGSQKAFGWFHGDGWHATVEAWGNPAGMGLPATVASLVIVIELLVAVSMFVGFLVRISAFGVIGVMTGAIYFVHSGGTLFELEYPLTLIAIALSLAVQGAGRLSMDRGISSVLLPAIG
jgi:putative oxidoreductase